MWTLTEGLPKESEEGPGIRRCRRRFGRGSGRCARSSRGRHQSRRRCGRWLAGITKSCGFKKGDPGGYELSTQSCLLHSAGKNTSARPSYQSKICSTQFPYRSDCIAARIPAQHNAEGDNQCRNNVVNRQLPILSRSGPELTRYISDLQEIVMTRRKTALRGSTR